MLVHNLGNIFLPLLLERIPVGTIRLDKQSKYTQKTFSVLKTVYVNLEQHPTKKCLTKRPYRPYKHNRCVNNASFKSIIILKVYKYDFNLKKQTRRFLISKAIKIYYTLNYKKVDKVNN